MSETKFSMNNNKIRILDEALISKIAAGEVIERPASVVKELLDNSIDAKANDIKIEIEGAGIKKIVVSDNGTGMNYDDASLAFEKHATSKLQTLENLDNILTLGFRGEALYSIAAVAKVKLITKNRNEIAGTQIITSASNIDLISEIGCNVGTTVQITDLFYNTPARRKFLKSMRTELAHIVDVVTKYALIHSNISFSLINDGKNILNVPATDNMLNNIIHIYGTEVARSLIPINLENKLIKISGYISKPEFTRSGSELQSFYINSRSILSTAIKNAVRLGYYTLIPKGRQPAAFLNITVTPSQVDVNIHPRKTEVRLNYEKEIMNFITSAVDTTLKSINLTPEIQPSKLPKQHVLYENKIEEKMIDYIAESQVPYHPPAKDTSRRLDTSKRLQNKNINLSEIKTSFGKNNIKVIGQFADLYIIASFENKLLLVDQHAAHERIMYERILDKKKMGWQELLNPVTLELNPKEKVILEDFIPYLEQAGFSISEFGNDSYVVTTIPTIFGKMEDPKIVYDIISDLISVGRINDETQIYQHVFSTMACRAAIKAGAIFDNTQILELLSQLKKCQNPYTCPHGRPTMISFTKDELDKMFKRK